MQLSQPGEKHRGTVSFNTNYYKLKDRKKKAVRHAVESKTFAVLQNYFCGAHSLYVTTRTECWRMFCSAVVLHCFMSLSHSVILTLFLLSYEPLYSCLPFSLWLTGHMMALLR